MKQRFNALDVRATVKNLKERLIGIRLQNVYDVNSKTFLFKFAKPDDKELVLLRKHLRTRRVTNVRQLGVDRIVDFEFAGGEMGIGYHIICEFYASGNIILTDHEYRILALLRAVQPSEELKIAVGEIYNIETVKDFEKVDEEHLRAVLKSAGPKDNLKKIMNIKFEYGPAMVEHMIMEAHLDPNVKVATDFDTSADSPMVKALLEAMDKGHEVIKTTQNAVPRGYIILLDDKHKPKVEGSEEVEIYDEFHPFLYKQFENRKYKEFDTFDKAVDEFFSAIESQKLEMKARRQEEAALKKLEAVRKEQESRVQSLLDQQHTNVRKAQVIELNLQLVDAAITIIRNAVASQMDWQDLNDLVKEEKRRQNPIAMVIDGLKLQTNQITLLLSDPDSFEESDSEDDEDSEQENDISKSTAESSKVKVDVDIGLSAFANARKYYEQKKTTASKHEKTLEASSKALKSAERKIRQDLKETKITATINKIRKPFWFEKFLWFISTDGHLVIAGRDMQQNEMLVKRYLLKDDVYVHADLHGAASVIVKNKPNANGQPIPPSTLYQAGIMSVCQSKAWDSKMVTSAYWVYPDQVSKSAPSGEYLTTGSFMIRGKKNFLPPVQLVYGFGYVFKLDESSIGNHVKARVEDHGQANHKVDYRDAIEESTAKKESGSNEQLPKKEKTDATPTPEKAKKDENSVESNDETSDDSNEDSSSDEEENAFPDTQLQSLPAETDTKKDSHDDDMKPLAKADKYDLQDYGHDSDDQVSSSSRSSGANTPSKKRISAKERRLMKKLNVTELTEAILSEKEKAKQQKQAQPTQQQQKAAQAKQKAAAAAPPPSTRGRKSKAKKIKDKYADQDEEERQLRMELLGSNKGPQPKGKKAKREAKAKEEKTALEREKAARKAAAEEKARKKEGEANGHGDDIKGTDDKDTETIRQMLKEENITMLEADEIANLSILDSLTANPLPEDIIHFAIPVCAPYAAIQKYKYKVKLTPGSLKRGKAVKQAQSVFLNLNEATAREKELIKGVPDMESINTMMSKVKVSAPNLEASKRKKAGGRK
ncbi:fibronectin-binding protein A N-terminus-domain-containing protein [Mycotypha africana]|uniref:fibronectin-binding protein A N-terminus-domain-containing protein n=1 Tax=Mycotypha africana TaxID=64632 RepID=UPI0022FFDB65|nr:fibronectin-binding protein A N-terminus-domain-containing protein [Mycotypha africana]KAI8988444.1 fibronectin-binding protein A N-terminus-domain-containing protein [Mycotypha africana]